MIRNRKFWMGCLGLGVITLTTILGKMDARQRQFFCDGKPSFCR